MTQTAATVMSTVESCEVSTEDWHTGGEPFRIIPQLPPHCAFTSTTVSACRHEILNTPNHPVDLLRRTLCYEPRGHADMYGGFILPPNDPGAHLGVLFWHKDGFSTACGHGTIALGYWAVSSGLVPARDDSETDVVIDVPSGRVTAKVEKRFGKITNVTFINVPSYAISLKNRLVLNSNPGVEVVYDLGWGGALYAYIEVAQLGLNVSMDNHGEFVRLGREVQKLVRGHKWEGEGVYGICFWESMDSTTGTGNSTDGKNTLNNATSEASKSTTLHQRNVVVFADGAIDRSPCGSGTAARVGLLYAHGEMDTNSILRHESIVGSVFEAKVQSVEQNTPTEFRAVIPRVTGTAHRTGRHAFYVDFEDPLCPGFVFR